MQNLTKPKIRIVRKHRQPEVLKCGSVISTITFSERKDGRVKGEVKYHTDYSIVPTVRPVRDEPPEWI